MATFTSVKRPGTPRELLLASSISAALVVLTHSALAVVPFLLTPEPSLLLPTLPLSGFVMLASLGFGRFLKRLLGVPSSAPASVLFHLLFVWAVHLALIRPASSPMLSMIFYLECVMLVVGLSCILSSDPGLVSCGDAYSEPEKCRHDKENHYHEEDLLLPRVRHCKSCKACFTGLDHHCPAFGKCIGKKNHRLFIALLAGFIIAEASFSIFSCHYVIEFITDWRNTEGNLSLIIIFSTMHFCMLQVIWQVLFFMWHFYCVCSNIRTEEWINWKKYPEFHVQTQQSEAEYSLSELVFRNPYDKGVFANIKEFIGLN